jgi:rod shape-determining protein MreC
MYRRPGRGRLLLAVCLALSLLLITLDFRQNRGGVIRRAKDLAVAVVTPVQRGFTAVTQPVGDLFGALGDLANIRSRNRELEDRLDRLQAEVREAQSLQDVNERLHRVLELGEAWQSMDRATAQVISKAPSNYQWAVVIGKGRADGIRPNMAVIDPEGLVGKVIRADRNQATVLLLIDPDAAAGARIEGARDTGVVRGNGSSEHLSIEFVAPDADVRVGDDVITSGYDGGIFPSGIPIGVVAEVGPEDAGFERDVRVEAAADFPALDYVTVLLETGPRLQRKVAGG